MSEIETLIATQGERSVSVGLVHGKVIRLNESAILVNGIPVEFAGPVRLTELDFDKNTVTENPEVS